jgi:hypothetical protein
VPEIRSAWTIEGFLERLDMWVAQESPAERIRWVVTAWVMTRMDDPYLGVQREPTFDNLWFGPVPDTDTPDGHVVVCSYWIIESTHTVRCDTFATLRRPV